MASHPLSNGRVREPLNIRTELPQCLSEIGGPAYGGMAKSRSDRCQARSSRSRKSRLTAITTSLRSWFQQDEKEAVYWIEQIQCRMGTRILLRSSPIEVGESLRKLLFNAVPSVIMTSATLATGRNGGIEFYKSRIGASGVPSIQLGSPFRYQEQAELIILKDMPDPSSDKRDYEAKLPR